MHSPATAMFALTAIGTPANGRGSPGSIASASASARSASSSTNAPSCGSIASIRRSAASTASRAVNEPSRMRAASSVAGRKASASMHGCEHTTPIRAAVFGLSRRTLRRMSEVQSGLEGVVAFATEIAEPDREGGALRYRGVDIEELVGRVPFEQVWGLLVDGDARARAAAGRAASARRSAPATRASTCRPRSRCSDRSGASGR